MENKNFDSFVNEFGNIIICSTYWDFMGEKKIMHHVIGRDRADEILTNLKSTIDEFDKLKLQNDGK